MADEPKSQNPGGNEPEPGGEPKAAVALEWIPETETIDLVEAGKTTTTPLRGVKTLSKFKTAADLARGYVNLERHAGGMIRIPGEKATPEERAAYNEKLGVPRDPAGYEIKEIKAGDTVLVNEADTANLTKWMHEQGMTRKQAQSVIDRFVQFRQAQADEKTMRIAEDAEASYAEIAKDWGSLTNRHLALVQRGVREFFGEEFSAWLDETGAGNDPRFLKGALRVFTPMLDDGLIQGENLGMSQADAKAEIDKLMHSKEYTSSDKSVRLPIVKRINELIEIAHAA